MPGEMLAADCRLAARALGRSPGWAASVICSLALGIGANVAIFSLTYAVLLKSLPVPDPNELILYTFSNGKQNINLSGPAYDSLLRHQTVTRDLLAWSNAELALDRNGHPQKIEGGLLSGNGFEVLGVRPYMGVLFGPEADIQGGGPNGYQAVLGYEFWRNHLDGRSEALGKRLTVNGRPVTIIGVLPRGFAGLVAGRQVDMVLPLSSNKCCTSLKLGGAAPGLCG
jgi:putative ABC transport system permease protein